MGPQPDGVLGVLRHHVRLPLIKASSTMVLYGEDRLRDGEELLHNNIVNARKVILPGIGHIPQVEDPEGFLGALMPFLAE